MRFIGGPKDGEPLHLDPGYEAPKTDVTVTSSYMVVEDGEERLERQEKHLYRPDAFGNLRHVRRLE